MLSHAANNNAVTDIFCSSPSLLIQRNGDFALYRYQHDSDRTTDDNDLITEIAWVTAISLQSVAVQRTLGLKAEESLPWFKIFTCAAMKKQESLLYYIRYEPTDQTRQLLSEVDPKHQHVNKIIAINIREDHCDPIVAVRPSSSESSKVIRSLIETADNMYIKYLKETIVNETQLESYLTNRHQLLYLSIGGVLSEFRDHGLYKWFRPLIMEDIQERYHYKRAYGISFSPASTHVHQKDGYRIIGEIQCKQYEYPTKSENYPLKDILDGQDEIHILEKIFTDE